MTSGTGTPGHIGADPRLHGFAPRAGVLPASQPPSRLRLSPTGTLPGRRHPQRLAACRRDGWHPGEDLHRSPHLPCAPHPMSPPGPPGIAPAAASPSPSCRSPSWLGDPAWGQPSGWGGLRAKLSPPNPRAPRRGAWPGERAPFPVPAVLWPALGCSVPRSAGGCSTFAALSHRRPAAAASSPAPAEKGSRSFPPPLPPASGPSSGGAGRGARRPGGLSPLTPHLGAVALCAGGGCGSRSSHSLPFTGKFIYRRAGWFSARQGVTSPSWWVFTASGEVPAWRRGLAGTPPRRGPLAPSCEAPRPGPPVSPLQLSYQRLDVLAVVASTPPDGLATRHAPMETAPGQRSRWLDDKGYGCPARGEGDWEVLCAPRMGKASAVLGSMPGAAADWEGCRFWGMGTW